MRNCRKLLLMALLPFTLTGCWVYMPQLADVPLIDPQGDVRVTGSVYLMPTTGATATVSAGLTRSIALQLHADFETRDAFYSQAAVGFYHPYAHSLLEGCIGLEQGRGDVYFDAYGSHVYGPCLVAFAQMNYGWLLSEHNDLGVAMKVGRMASMMNGGAADAPADYEDALGPNSHTLLEPQLFCSVGGSMVKSQLQAGYLYLSNWPDVAINRYIPLSFSTGINITI